MNIKICLFGPDFTIIIQMPTEFGRLANFDFINVYMNEDVLLELLQFHLKLFSMD